MQFESFDFVVIGSGFGGSIMSMVLRRLGRSVLLVERGTHPRFVIGESSTPFANLLLERLAEDFDLPFLRSLSEWGSWQRDFPELQCGLKRGFTFYYHTQGRALNPDDPATQLLVAASPNDRVADTHWYRPAFDEFLVSRAKELGVLFYDQTEIVSMEAASSGWQMVINTPGGERYLRTAFVIDATGPGRLPQLGNEVKPCPFMPPTSAVYAHFRNVRRLVEPEHPLSSSVYPPDDAAVHHVFPDGWIWMLRFNNGITSAGAALNRNLIHNANLAPRDLWNTIVETLPTVAALLRDAIPVTPFYFTRQLSYRRIRACGPGWAALPSSAGFIDPLLSTGFALNLLGILRLAQAFKNSSPDLSNYERESFRELDAAADLVSALYSKMDVFDEFAQLSLLYFAALSYTETAWRLGKSDLASGFLLADNADFSSARARLCARARAGERITRAQISSVLEPFDVAGLTQWNRFPYYPVNLDDLYANAHKLKSDDAEIDQLLKKLHFQGGTPTSLNPA